MAKKLIVVLGPTASGKSELAVKLARKFNGEVVSVDSRQVYKGMDIGTGKVTKQEMAGVPHHLLDIASPKTRFNVSQYRKLALKAINKIFKKNKTPILCGGTGFYIQAVIDGILIPAVKPDWRLRDKLEKRGTKELFDLLKKLDPRRAKAIDKKNRRRLIRALEIVIKTKKPVPLLKKDPIPYPVLIIGVKKPPEEESSVKEAQKLEIKTASVENEKEEEPEEEESSSAKASEEKEEWFEPEGQLAIDVYQTENELIIQSTIAGVKSENLDVSLEKDIIAIKGCREKPFEKEGDYFTQECYWGSFSREIIMPVEVDPSRALAELKEGILTIRIPKIVREKKKKIIVKIV